MRAKLGIVYICITIIIATFPVHNCDKKSLHIAIHLHPSYFLSFHINKFAHYFASNNSRLYSLHDCSQFSSQCCL